VISLLFSNLQREANWKGGGNDGVMELANKTWV
jgi:hypothetical protein